MKKKQRTIALIALVVLSLLAGVFGCAAPTPTPTPTPTPKASPSPSPTPTPTPSPSPTQPAVIKWKMQSAYEFVSAWPQKHGIAWVEWVKNITNGRLQIEIQPPGTFAKGTEILSALSKGTFEVALDYAGFYPETVPISEVETGLPLAWQEAFQVHDAYYNRGLWELVREAYAKQNVVPLAVAYDGGDWYHFGTKFPLKSLDDIKGKKIRATGIYAKYTQALGGLPTVVSAGETYMALKTGIIDGFLAGIAQLDSYKLREVITHYITEPTLTTVVSSAPWVNKDAWNKLPDDLKQLLENTRYFYAEAGMRYKIEAYKTVTSAEKEWGLTWVKLSAADVKKATDIALSLWDEVAKKSPEGAKGVEIVKQQMRDYGKIK